MEWNLLSIGVAGFAALIGGLFLVLLLYKPLGLLFKLAMHLVIGVALLTLCNLALGLVQMHLALNLVTILVAGFLYLPGIILLLIINYWFI